MVFVCYPGSLRFIITGNREPHTTIHRSKKRFYRYLICYTQPNNQPELVLKWWSFYEVVTLSLAKGIHFAGAQCDKKDNFKTSSKLFILKNKKFERAAVMCIRDLGYST